MSWPVQVGQGFATATPPKALGLLIVLLTTGLLLHSSGIGGERSSGPLAVILMAMGAIAAWGMRRFIRDCRSRADEAPQTPATTAGAAVPALIVMGSAWVFISTEPAPQAVLLFFLSAIMAVPVIVAGLLEFWAVPRRVLLPLIQVSQALGLALLGIHLVLDASDPASSSRLGLFGAIPLLLFSYVVDFILYFPSLPFVVAAGTRPPDSPT